MTTCANPRCGNQFPDRVHVGRPVKYCNRSCKNKHWEAGEYTDAKIKYRESAKGKAVQSRKGAKWRKTEKGLASANKLKIRDDLHRIKIRLAKEPRICKTCRDDIDPMTDRTTYCCNWCWCMDKYKLPKKPTARVCPVCELTHYRSRPCCSTKCSSIQYRQQPGYKEKSRSNKKAWLQTPNGVRWKRLQRSRRRARLSQVWDEDVDVVILADWQRWKCYLCNKPISSKIKYPDQRSLSLDHIVPLSLGGRHSYANCAATHLRCNSHKQAQSMNEQLKLC
jgi:hypothetical protein